MKQIYLDYWFNAETEHLDKMLGADAFIKILGNPEEKIYAIHKHGPQ